MNDNSNIKSQIIEKFKTISNERISRLNNAIVFLETTPSDSSVSEEVMREIHTLKGDARMVGFINAGSVAHRIEDLLLLSQNAGIPFTGGLGDLILTGLDLLSLLVSRSGDDQSDKQVVDKFLADSSIFLSPENPARTIQSPPPVTDIPKKAEEENIAQRPKVSSRDSGTGRFVHVDMDKINDLNLILGDMLIARSRLSSALNGFHSLINSNESEISSLHDFLRGLKNTFSNLQKYISTSDVHLSYLDEKIRSLRLVPISELYTQFPRLIRDLAKKQGKKISFSTQGDDIEIDKQILDKLSDPLVHIIRNAIDHGIESSSMRTGLGKPEVGSITISSKQQGTKIEIEVRDDGRGIDLEKVVSKAVKKNIVDANDVAFMSDEMKRDLIFSAGFSTRDSVTDISGRGIGLDVAKQHLEAINGSVTVQSRPGKYTTFILSAPLSMAVAKVLIVEESSVKYAIPSLSIDRVAKRRPLDLISIGRNKAVEMGSELIPLANLGEILGTKKYNDASGAINIVLMRNPGQVLGLEVDRLVGETEVIIQPVDPFFSGLKMIYSTVTTVDTDLVFVLSPAELLRAAKELNVTHSARKEGTTALDSSDRTILVVDDSDVTRDLIIEIVKSHGYRVMEAGNGEEALSILSSSKIDLILSDIEMPLMDGFQLVSRVREKRSTKYIPFIILSTRGSDDDKRQAMDRGADAYIVKREFQEDLLYSTINRYIGKSSNRDQG